MSVLGIACSAESFLGAESPIHLTKTCWRASQRSARMCSFEVIQTVTQAATKLQTLDLSTSSTSLGWRERDNRRMWEALECATLELNVGLLVVLTVEWHMESMNHSLHHVVVWEACEAMLTVEVWSPC